ncbi:hypothetical protein C1I95_02580 [Micromonospora craterilacus]|uniref:Uncharacterized protein n=1 Tax=Micromonospora craterilacus TaxID=1655439 RepID=A0A2W2FPK6_9ACTN|nr:hypothetical protein [Micromonospora craterilacus]PZG23787.1 hypothetical protein C1I95_02580 [Micromonospora craterilacus]
MEAHKEPLIDLGMIGERPPRSGDRPRYWWRRYWWRRFDVSARVLALAALGVLLLGGVIGGVGMRNWDLTQHERAETSTASVLVLADTVGPMTAVVEGQRLRVDGQMTVVNTGPRLVNVQDLKGDEQGVTLRALENQRWIKPGEWLTVDVTATLDCATGVPAGPVGLRILIQTADDRFGQVSFPVALKHTRWDQSCVRAG